ncbi:MAG: RNA polymerase sigma factor [Gammaproteobacteria bacterium]|nr:RNA polymerase sigma factor [Gammaproteobacteria bacterium]
MADQTDLRQNIVAVIPRMRRFAWGLCGNAADADDLVQVALEKALTRLHQFEPGTRLDSWLFRIVQTSFLDERRKAARREETLDMEAIDRLPNGAGADNAEQAVVARDVDSALAILSEDQRTLILLVLVEGYSYQQASDTLDVPIGTIMSRLSRARKTLVSYLKEAAQ